MTVLESEVNALKQQQGEGDLASFRQDVDKRLAAVQEAQKKLEEVTETLSRAGVTPGGAAAPSGDATDSDAADVWTIVGVALGTAPEGHIRLDGDTYKMRRGWLLEELRLAITGKQLPRLAADKKTPGVIVRGVKPKSLAEQLGFKNADVVVEVAGKAVASPADINAALRAATSPLEVKLQRKGSEVVQLYAFSD